ncbi:MAG: phosphate acetyltransferase [Defluviitaleaceae bacterium]|nr:phosphate acetyltransferase [Defluviitaleaceae bacterium]
MQKDFMAQLLERARRAPRSIAFPEALEEKVLLAARKVLDLGVAKPILIGQRAEIEAAAAKVGVTVEGFEIVDNSDEAICADLIEQFLKISSDFSEKTLLRKFKAPLNFAAAMVKCGKADCLAAGVTHTTGDVVYTSQVFIGLKEGISTVSSLGVVECPNFETSEGHLLAITDCAVCTSPDSEELADIAITTSDTMRKLLDWEPRTAILSYSTKGSGQHEVVDKAIAAVKIANEKRPDLNIDGEFQIDAAIIPAVAAKKVKEESAVAGKANILVFPDLQAGNIGVKLIQIFGGCLAYGPLLQGFMRPVTDFSRSAPVDEIVGNLTMLSVLAQDD